MVVVRRFIVAVVVVTLSGTALAVQEQKGFGPYNEKMIEIDGAKTPTAIPDWLVWSTTFRIVSAFPSGKLPVIGISLSETEVVMAAAKRAVDADAKCNKGIPTRLAILKLEGKKPLAVYRENQKLILACRQEQLDIADELMNILAYESRPAMRVYVDARRKGITRTVPEKELKFFRSPR